MADRRPSQLTVLRRRVAALEAALEQHRAESDAAIRAILEAIARLPGARGSMPPPKN